MTSNPDGPQPEGNEVIIGIDESRHSEVVVRWAARTASERGRTLRIVHALELGAVMDPAAGNRFLAVSGAVERMQARGADALARAGRSAHAVDPNLRLSCELSPETAARALVDRSPSAYQMVVGVAGDFGAGHIGSTVIAVASHSQSPVAVVRGDLDKSPRPSSAPVVLGWDGSPAGERAIAVAFDEASWRGASLIVLHAWSDASLGVLAARHELLTPPEEFEQYESVIMAEQLAHWQAKYPNIVVSRKVYLDGPRQHLLRWSQRAQLVVVGTRGRGGMRGMLLGSTTSTLIQQSRCPVLAVPPGTDLILQDAVLQDGELR